MKERVEEVLAQVRPALQADGGDVELVDVNDEGVVSVKLTGACGSCPMSTMTLKMGIEKTLVEKGIDRYYAEVMSWKEKPQAYFTRLGYRIYDSVATTVFKQEVPDLRVLCIDKYLA